MKRNPYFKVWSKDAMPDGYPDQITQSFGLTVEAQITAIENGQYDWTLEAPPADRLTEMGTKYASQTHVETLTAFWYAPMNVNLTPFTSLKARQAVNYAIDRNALVKIFGGPKLAVPNCQVLPPGFPGNKPYCPYTKNPGTTWSAPDVAKAKQLVNESGQKGAKVVVISPDDEVQKAVGVYLASVLNQIGFKATAKTISGNIAFTYVAEHEEQGADQRAAVVPGLSGCVGLPAHPVRLRVVPPGQRLEHQHRRLLQQADQRPDAQGAEARADELPRREPALGEDRPSGDGPGPDGDAVHAAPHRLPVEARRELHVQQAVLLAGRPVLGAVAAHRGAR